MVSVWWVGVVSGCGECGECVGVVSVWWVGVVSVWWVGVVRGV